MKNLKILPDTCVWVDYFRDKNSLYGDYLEPLIAEDKIYTCGIIVSELLSGARTERESKLIKYTMEALNIVDMPYTIYINAGRTRGKLLSNGKTIPLTDIVIAETCIKNNLALLTNDKHFNAIQKYTDLKVIK